MFLDISDLSHFKKKTKSIYLLKTQKLVKEDSKIHRLRQAKIPLTLFFLLLKNYKVSTDWSHQSPVSNFPFYEVYESCRDKYEIVRSEFFRGLSHKKTLAWYEKKSHCTKEWSFPLRISSVNVTRFGHIYWRNP